MRRPFIATNPVEAGRKRSPHLDGRVALLSGKEAASLLRWETLFTSSIHQLKNPNTSFKLKQACETYG